MVARSPGEVLSGCSFRSVRRGCDALHDGRIAASRPFPMPKRGSSPAKIMRNIDAALGTGTLLTDRTTAGAAPSQSNPWGSDHDSTDIARTFYTARTALGWSHTTAGPSGVRLTVGDQQIRGAERTHRMRLRNDWRRLWAPMGRSSASSSSPTATHSARPKLRHHARWSATTASSPGWPPSSVATIPH